MGEIIKGKPVADKISEDLIQEIEGLKGKGIQPKLAIVRVGANSSDLAYEKGALGRSKKVGVETEVHELPEDITQDDFIKELKKLNEDKAVNGILIFRPLPEQLDESVIKYVIAPEKDIDCLSPINVGKMTEGDKTGFPPCTPTAVVEILKFYGVELQGKDCAIIGASMVVGKPAALLLLNENATISVCHIFTKDSAKIASQADVVVVGVGVPRLVKENWIANGAVVIDVGINVDKEGNMCGDVDFDGVKDKVSMITPVPGGVGSVTTSILAKHVVKACKQQNNL
ncbi:Methylenetetrahydrofolate dehydrogenase (NADP(+)) [Alkaliphilus metalliredigens QYMF]|uniref:Bifunctional protein FolD n=1 Tax=Alkaliphilus metalliredigens (strain QYMF) TaxID=293826 RepID=FOLD_ALKMQ|nr:bifunctional 5,10-methylenetetrahydrofolate dehydrogenase/5,10-methenyltetrahydrofolate cyclohydrolase [Alkaliphilus metalliredigens]A6TPR4.1 RecName: Full=Bifunctional protein FolD; Includes: RecName: Full=Methylenetetrahydrofolate dehydrogenase; Includes: RecName: Full=Methenyltetrahydrofolate cyclohydrolase [Alkaliphilus metalliredigens QYMF]ABR48182.1 Methylenetetrahydrofolate dehydrogenase (NADP(+)) [Alkaliphilus metalliredigens QYMF]